MKAVIVFSSKHGATKKIAGLIAEKLNNFDIKVFDLNETPDPNLENFDLIVIGGSIYFGEIQKRIKTFCIEHSDFLLKKKIALFISCLTKEQELEEFNNAFPETLRKASIANGLLGGELIYKNLNLLEKLAIRFVGKTSADVHEINYNAINEFSNRIKEVLKTAEPVSCAV